MLPILLTLLLTADLPSPAPDARPVCAVWLAELTPERVANGTVRHFVFVSDSLVDEHDGCYGLEAAGPSGVSRTVQFAKGESDEGLDLRQPIVVEGELHVVRHKARGEFRAVVELQVREARLACGRRRSGASCITSARG